MALGAAAGFFALQAVIPGPLPTAMMLLAIAVPLGCFWIYLATLRRIHAFSALSSESLIRRYMPGLWWRLSVGWAAGLVGALLVGTQLLAFGGVDWVILALALPVFLGTWKLLGERLRSEILPCYRLGWSLRAATWPAATILALLDVGAIWLRGGVPRYESLGSAIDAGRAGAAMFGDSAISAVLVQVAGMLNGLQAYALGYLSGGDGGLRAVTALLVFGLLSWAFYLTVSFYIASFLVPAREYARVLAPLSHTPTVPAVPPSRAFTAAAFGAIVLLMFYPAAVAVFDHWLGARPWVKEQLDRIEIAVEKVDDILVSEGTLDEIARKLEEIALRRAEQRETLEAVINAGFDRMEENVEGYLDWYYSLEAEYGRIGSMLVGDLEDYMAIRLKEFLGAGDPFGPLEAEIESLLAEDAEAIVEYQNAVAEILSRNRVEPGVDARHVAVVAEARSDDLLFVPHTSLISLEARLGVGAAGGIAGMLTGVMAAKVVSKMIAKGTLQTGAKVLLKVLGGRVVGSAGVVASGAAAGAAIGSVVPGAGTMIGAVVGGVTAGLAVGAGAEYLMLKLEEAYSRDDHRAELVEALRKMRAEAIAQLRLEPTPAAAQ